MHSRPGKGTTASYLAFREPHETIEEEFEEDDFGSKKQYPKEIKELIKKKDIPVELLQEQLKRDLFGEETNII